MSWNLEGVNRRWRLLLLSLLWLIVPVAAGEVEPALEFRASDKSFTMSTADDFRVTYNPHAVLSLASLEDVAVVVTKRKAQDSIGQIYDGFVKTLPADYPCKGRVMITVDGQQTAAFVLEGMFPPEGEPTHQTLLAIAVRDGQEYNFMIHYPLEHEQQGMERAYEMLNTIRWAKEPIPAAP